MSASFQRHCTRQNNTIRAPTAVQRGSRVDGAATERMLLKRRWRRFVVVSSTSGDRTTTMTSGIDFQHETSY